MEFRKSSTFYKKLANGRSFNDKSAYDGVFATPPKRGTPVFSAGLEDYREIFGGSRGSSIPILDFSALQEKKPSIDVRNSKLEYSKVFGTLEELDFSVPYEELKGEPKKADIYSERPLSTAGRVSSPVGKGSSMDLDKEEVFSHEYQSLEEMKRFNVAFNKVNQGGNNSTKGITHVVQVQATSGYTCIFNEFSPLQASEGGKPASKAGDDIRIRIKAVGSTEDTKDHASASLGRQSSTANGFQNKDGWYGNQSLKMKFDSCNLDQGSGSAEPTISSRSAQVGKNLNYLETSISSKSEVCVACEKAGTVCSSPCFDEEVDENSVAAASIAALRKAIEDAQAMIKIAKELMERRKGGLYGRKMSFTDKLNCEERRESGNSYSAARSKDEKSRETFGKPEVMVNHSSEMRNQNLRELPEVANVKIQSKNISLGRAHCGPEKSELLGKEKFYELDHADNKPFENAYHDETITKLQHAYDQKQNRTDKTIDKAEEFSVNLHRVEASNGKECGEEKIHLVKEKGFYKELKLARAMHFREDDENIATKMQKMDETEESVGISYEKEKYGSRGKENQQKLAKDNEKLDTQELEENNVKKEIKADVCLEDENIKIIFKQNEEQSQKHQMSYEKKILGNGIEEQLEGPELFPGDENVETKKLDENSSMRQTMARDWVEYLKVKMGFKQDKNLIGEKVLMSFEKENCQEILREPPEVKELVQEGQKLEAQELEELTVRQQVKGDERIEDVKVKIVNGQVKNEIRGNDFVCGEDKEPAQVDELGRAPDCLDEFRNGGETELEENGKFRRNKKHQKAGEDEEKIADLSNQIEENGKICELFEGKRIDLKFDKIAEADIKITQDDLNFCEGRLEVTGDLCNWNLNDNLNKNGGACEILDHEKMVEETVNHPLSEDSKNNFEDTRNEMEVVEASVETERIRNNMEEHMQVNELEENASLAEDTFILQSGMESSNEVEELMQTFSSDIRKIFLGISDIEFEQKKCENDVKEHKNDFTSDMCAEEFASKVEEVHEFGMENEILDCLQEEGTDVQSNDDKGLQRNVDDLNECYPLRMSEEKGKLTMAAEENITNTTKIEVHQASETEEECCTNDIFDGNNSGQALQSEICENKKIQITAIDDENDPVTSPAEDQEIIDTRDHGNNRIEADWPPLSEEDKFIKKTLERETNQNFRVNEEKHQTTQTLEDTMNHGNSRMAADWLPLSEEDKFIKKTLEGVTNQNVRVNEERHQTTQTLEDMGMNEALKNEGMLESEVENQDARTDSMNEGIEQCIKIDEETKTEMPDVEGDQKQQIVPPKIATETNHEFVKPAEVGSGHQRKNDESKESEEEKEQSDVENEGRQQIVSPKEGGTQTNHKSERLMEVPKEHQRKIDEAKENEKGNKQGDLENEQNQQIIPPKEGTQTKHEVERLAEAEKENLRKTDEVKEREKEKERERIAVERAIREARERAFSEARERVAAERASAQTGLKEKNTAREQSVKSSTESNTKLGAEKASIEAKLRAERNAVERATAEARERALEKAMSRKAFSEAKNLAEKIVEEKLSNAANDSERRRDFPLNHNDTSASTSSRNTNFSNVRVPDSSENDNGSIGETTQRNKAKLEKHQRTVERVAKALAEKNFRDRRAQQEQVERNRLAESLDADVKRWSSGKEGNLRLLLSTLQYILGPDSGWQPIPLTDILATTAVKKAYRKATLWVHPDKLQQRGASIQQKYVCEKVFDLLQAAWNRFNAEER